MKKYLEEFNCKPILKACRENGSQTKKKFGYSKVTAVAQNSGFRGLLIVIFRRIKYNEEQHKLLYIEQL